MNIKQCEAKVYLIKIIQDFVSEPGVKNIKIANFNDYCTLSGVNSEYPYFQQELNHMSDSGYNFKNFLCGCSQFLSVDNYCDIIISYGKFLS